MSTAAAEILQNRIIPQIAKDLTILPQQALAAVTLLNEGATVPFILLRPNKPWKIYIYLISRNAERVRKLRVKPV
jgi:hypothetical protein